MKATIYPSTLQGTVAAPASKSAMQRACAAALIHKGRTILHNPGVSADDKAALDIIQQLGASVIINNEIIQIESAGINPVSHAIHCGESGLSVRMFTSIAALSKEKISITGVGSLTRRPLHFFNEVLPQLSVECISQNGLLPLTIQGPLQPQNITVDGSLSSQFLTGLLFAYSAAQATDVTISVTNLNSKPYVDLTLQMLKLFGLKVPKNNSYQSFYFDKEVGETNPQTIDYTVEGDWSGGAFLLVAGAINGDIIVKGLDLFSVQADKAILQALNDAGAIMSVKETEISIQKSVLKAFHFNATHSPDLFPPLVALASFCEGTTAIEGVHRLTHKESNRALTLQEEFGKMGVVIKLQNDLMLIEGTKNIQGTNVHSRHDHRIAMACSVAALRADSEVVIDEAEAINKSYPNFYQHLKQLGASISLSEN